MELHIELYEFRFILFRCVHHREYFCMDLQGRAKHFLHEHFQNEVGSLLFMLLVLSLQRVVKVVLHKLIDCFLQLGNM